MGNPFKETTYAIACRGCGETDTWLFEGTESASFDVLKNSWRYWYADPLVFTYQGEDWLFTERMDRLTHRGGLAAAQIANGKVGAFREVLSEPYHLSYPMVFEKDGAVYMIPEATAGKCVNLYRCEHFPDKWVLQKTLFEDVLYADSNMVFYHGHWYFITGEMDPHAGAKTKTLVFLADHIETGELTPLADNANSAFSFEQRGAGNFFYHEESLIRPIQCGDEAHYGKCLRFTAAQPDNPEQERELARIEPKQVHINTKKSVSGIHSYAKTADLEIIDVQMAGYTNLPTFIGRVLRRLRR